MAMTTSTNSPLLVPASRSIPPAMIAQTMTENGLATSDAVKDHEGSDKSEYEPDKAIKTSRLENGFMRIVAQGSFLHSPNIIHTGVSVNG